MSLHSRSTSRLASTSMTGDAGSDSPLEQLLRRGRKRLRGASQFIIKAWQPLFAREILPSLRQLVSRLRLLAPVNSLLLLVSFGVIGNIFVESLATTSYLSPTIPPNVIDLTSHIDHVLAADSLTTDSAPSSDTTVAIIPDSNAAIDRSGRTSSEVRPSTYVIQSGDTLSTIAGQFHLLTDTLKFANKLSNVNDISLGQTLRIPATDYTAGELASFRAAEAKSKATASTRTKNGIVLAGAPDSPTDTSTGWMTPLHYQYISRGLGYGHQGIDYVAPLGTPVYSSCNGTVAKIGQYGAWNGGFGNNILIDCGANITMRYAHLSAYSSTALQLGSINRGDPVGAVGSTGNSTGDHLHFQVEKNGIPFDPGLR